MWYLSRSTVLDVIFLTATSWPRKDFYTHTLPPHTSHLTKKCNRLLYCATKKRAKKQAQKCMPLDTLTRFLEHSLNFLCPFWYFLILWHIIIFTHLLTYHVMFWHTFPSYGILYFLMYSILYFLKFWHILSIFIKLSGIYHLLAYPHIFWHTFSIFDHKQI